MVMHFGMVMHFRQGNVMLHVACRVRRMPVLSELVAKELQLKHMPILAVSQEMPILAVSQEHPAMIGTSAYITSHTTWAAQDHIRAASAQGVLTVGNVA